MRMLSFGLIPEKLREMANRLPPKVVFSIILLLFSLQAEAGVGKSLYSASLRYRVPFLLLVAIADVESSFNPLVISINGKRIKCPQGATCTYSKKRTVIKPFSKESATRILKELHRKGYNYDVGLMQINRIWIDKYKLPPEVFLDERYNALFGAFILRQLLNRFGYQEAIWRYNGSRSYLQKVQSKLESYTKR